MQDGPSLLRVLTDQNPWWSSGKVPTAFAPPFRRRDFQALRQSISSARMTAIVGPRQVGKTTLMYQMIESLLLEDHVDPRRLLFISMDFPRIGRTPGDPLTEALEEYSERIIARPWREIEEKSFIFLDEITKLEGWHRILKGWHDQKLPLKFTATDSSIAAVRRGVAESLVGRCDMQTVLPMDFADVLSFHGEGRDIDVLAPALRDAFARGVNSGTASILLKAFQSALGRLAPHERKILSRLQSYLYADGYPELQGAHDWAVAGRRLREYVDLILARDLLRLFEVRNPRAMNALVGLLADQTANRFDYSGIAEIVGLSSDGVREYLDYLEGIFLVIRSEFLTKSRASRLRKQRKLYFGNVGLANGLTGNVGPQLFENRGYLGRLVETAVADHCMRLLHALDPGREPQLFYWRNYRGQEVDMVLRVGKRPVPIEVKYQARVTSADRRPLLDFLDAEKDSPFGVIVTRNELALDGRILSVPLHLFLLIA